MLAHAHARVGIAKTCGHFAVLVSGPLLLSPHVESLEWATFPAQKVVACFLFFFVFFWEAVPFLGLPLAWPEFNGHPWVDFVVAFLGPESGR